MYMVRRKNLWFGVLGFLSFWIGVGWDAIHEHIRKQAYPPGWIFDYAPYQPALAKIGLLIFLAATIIGVARLSASGILSLVRKTKRPSTEV